jgi:heat shock protein HtpX
MSETTKSSDQANTRAALARPVAARAAALLNSYWAELSLMGPVTIYLCVTLGLLLQTPGIVIALGLALALAYAGPRITADTMLALYRAEPISPGQGVSLRAAIATLSERAGLVPSTAVAAFSAGASSRTAILMTEGLLRRHPLAQIVAIAAHEIAHIRAGDLRVFALADSVTRLAQALFLTGVLLAVLEAVAWLAGERVFGMLPILALLAAPTLNSQLQLRLPRDRDYQADGLAASLLGGTAPIIETALSMAPEFGSPVDDLRFPVPQRRSPIPSPLRAHISGVDRADRLRQSPPLQLHPPLDLRDEPLVSLAGVGPIELRPRNRWPGLWF